MACGCPSAATDCPSGPREVLRQGALGPLVPVGDHEALGRAMAAVLADPTPADALRARAADFSVAASADAYEALLATLAGSAAHSAGQSAPLSAQAAIS